MDLHARRRGANTVTVRHDAVAPPSYIPKAALMFSLVAAIIAIITQFTRSPPPTPSFIDQPPTTNVTSISDLVGAVFDAPRRGHFFRIGCFSSRSLQCHKLQDVSYVLDAVDVSEDGDSYVFRITKRQVRHMRSSVLTRRESSDNCTPWQHGSFFMKLDWFLVYYLPRSIASTLFGNSFTEGRFRRDRWGWCAETLPFATPRNDPPPFEDGKMSRDDESTQHAPTPSNPTSDQKKENVFRETPKSAAEQGRTYRANPINQEARLRQNVMYA